jgi:two-component system chemotaxis response regulator CheB
MTTNTRIKSSKSLAPENLIITQADSTSDAVQFHNLLSDQVILMGASTGGTEVISRILKNLRTDLPGILIVQHMPGEFTKAFANRLDKESNLHVKEAEDGDVIQPGNAYIANGFNHLKLVKENGHFKCKLEMGPLVNRHRPSVDVLFHSAVQFPGKSITAVLLTGMGADGSKGMLALHESGAMTFAQDEKSSVIFGMPKEAIKLNAAQKIGTPDDLVNWLNTLFQ